MLKIHIFTLFSQKVGILVGKIAHIFREKCEFVKMSHNATKSTA